MPTSPGTPAAAQQPGTHLSLVGVDVGGTKTRIVAERADGTRADVTMGSASWRHGRLFADAENLPRLARAIEGLGPLARDAVVAAGIHDCDTDAQVDEVRRELSALLNARVVVANDAQLLRYTTPARATIEVILGTGAITSGTTAEGERISVDGHSWPLGDRGSAPDLVHRALRAALAAGDRGAPDEDLLYPHLRRAFGATSTQELAARAHATCDAAAWGRHAALVFDAEEAGSPVAAALIDEAAREVALGVATVRRRGAVADVVIAGGGVITHQGRYENLLRAHLAELAPDLRLVVVHEPPANGALELAREVRAEAGPADAAVSGPASRSVGAERVPRRGSV